MVRTTNLIVFHSLCGRIVVNGWGIVAAMSREIVLAIEKRYGSDVGIVLNQTLQQLIAILVVISEQICIGSRRLNSCLYIRDTVVYRLDGTIH